MNGKNRVPRMTYFQESDAIHLSVSEDEEAGSVEISPDESVDYARSQYSKKPPCRLALCYAPGR
jgi:hypothetical protein